MSVFAPSLQLPWDLAWLTMWRDHQAHSPEGFSLPVCIIFLPSLLLYWPNFLNIFYLFTFYPVHFAFCTCSLFILCIYPPYYLGGKCLRPPGCTSLATLGSLLWSGLPCALPCAAHACPCPRKDGSPASLCTVYASAFLTRKRRPLLRSAIHSLTLYLLYLCELNSLLQLKLPVLPLLTCDPTFPSSCWMSPPKSADRTSNK